ncbi:MAG: GNAT family N-acetyltransferase [Candidatus Diapherotrites archaeon]|nr:GNAT family N-acetyltransferase [Candidatus Diapherotrites archaeon]
MIIRKAKLENAREISLLLCNTIKTVNRKDYTARQIKAWLTRNDYKSIKNKILSGRTIFVAINKSKIVGIIALFLNECKIGALYVKHTLHNQGIGTKLLNYAEKLAKRKGLKKLKLNSTKTAFEFYKSKGYKKIRMASHTTNGVKTPTILMVKNL